MSAHASPSLWLPRLTQLVVTTHHPACGYQSLLVNLLLLLIAFTVTDDLLLALMFWRFW
jgi:hypothetical protein